MFNYFRNYSSNAHQICCEDSRLKVYMTIASLMTLTFKVTSASQTTTFKLAISWTIFKLFKLGMMVDFCMVLNFTMTVKTFVMLVPLVCICSGDLYEPGALAGPYMAPASFYEQTMVSHSRHTVSF